MGSLMDKVRAAAAGTSKKSKPSDQKNTSEDSGPAFWPLIRQVTVRCNSPALASGAILVDLPGMPIDIQQDCSLFFSRCGRRECGTQ